MAQAKEKADREAEIKLWSKLHFERKLVTAITYVRHRLCTLLGNGMGLIVCVCTCVSACVRVSLLPKCACVCVCHCFCVLQGIIITVACFTAYMNIIYGVLFTTAQDAAWLKSVLLSLGIGEQTTRCRSPSCCYLLCVTLLLSLLCVPQTCSSAIPSWPLSKCWCASSFPCATPNPWRRSCFTR